MEFWNSLLFLLGAVAALVLLCRVILWFEKEYPGEGYDERQKRSRGNAYRAAFWVGTLYFLAYTAWLVPNGKERMLQLDPFLVVYVGLILQVMVFHICCLLTRSDLPLSGNSILSMVSYVVLGISNLLDYYWYQDNPYVADSMFWVKLINGVTFFSLAVMQLISHLRKEKA